MPRWPGSTRRSAGARHGACEDRHDSILRTTTDADGDGETPAASEAVIDVGGDAARGHEDNWRNIAITPTSPRTAVTWRVVGYPEVVLRLRFPTANWSDRSLPFLS